MGIGRYLPEMVVTNEDFTKIVDTSDEWITQRTGIKTRHITNGEPTYYLGAQAAKAALEDAGIKPADIDLIIVTTCTPDYYTPSTACLIQREIGAVGSMAMDINCACTGFDYGLDMARRYLVAEDGVDTVLLIASEELSKFTDYQDRSSCILFGDVMPLWKNVESPRTAQMRPLRPAFFMPAALPIDAPMQMVESIALRGGNAPSV